MAFNSVYYIVFLACAVLIYYLLPIRFRSFSLTLFSLIFIFFSGVQGFAVLVGSAFFNYFIGRGIAGASGTRKKIVFLSGISINLLGLVMYKYIQVDGIVLKLIYFDINHLFFAIGFSFYTLQNIAFLSDVFNRLIEPPAKIANYLLYISFFPKAIAGPIEIPQRSFKWMQEEIITDSTAILEGTQRILIGLFKKMVLADRLAPSIQHLFSGEQELNGLTVMSSLYLFTIQLYFDFSGYTDIALGSARMFGVKLPENFNRPFLSLSITEFWRRWHMSLIQWFTRYIFYPVSMGLRNLAHIAVPSGIVLTFLVSGLWHGSGITFIVWSLLHCTYLLCEYFTSNFRNKWIQKKNGVKPILCIILVFNLVCFSNLFFRADSWDVAVKMLTELFDFSSFIPADIYNGFVYKLCNGGDQISVFNFLITITLIFVFFLMEGKFLKAYKNKRVSFGMMALLLLLIMLLGNIGDGAKFIYRQF